jgi:hypothetical protein
MAMVVNGVKYYLVDDCCILSVKLQNAIDDFYYDDKPCNINKLENDLETLDEARRTDDYKTMQRIFNQYMHWFKRYR